MSMINATLPIDMRVIAKHSFNRYTLLLNHKEVSTKSLIELEIGAEYIAELYENKGGVITFKNLYKKPKIAFFEEGLALIVRLLEEPNFNFKAFVLSSLIGSKNSATFSIYKEMLFALSQGIYHIPFVFENKPCLFQLRLSTKQSELFLFFSVFGNLKLVMKEGASTVYTPFYKVARFLKEHLSLDIVQEKSVTSMFEFKKLLDFKG